MSAEICGDNRFLVIERAKTIYSKAPILKRLQKKLKLLIAFFFAVGKWAG